MGNQHPSTLEDRIRFLARNAVFGDGQLWRHPECRNCKMIFTSTTPELLEVKRNMVPEIFKTGVKAMDCRNHKGRFENAKPMFRLASIVHPIITEVKTIPKEQLFSELELTDFGLWYLDDGSCVKRSDSNPINPSYRFIIAIGDCANTPERKTLFEQRLRQLFGEKWGNIRPNNSKATENNKSWFLPKTVAEAVMQEALKYGVLDYKFPLR